MKILTAEQTKEWDSYTIEQGKISSLALMEQASKAFVGDWFIKHFDKSAKVAVFCGIGNNGGDGLAISRLLLSEGYEVIPFVVRLSEKGSDDFESNYQWLSEYAMVNEITAQNDFPTFTEETVIIDAIFGSGLNRPIEGFSAELIKHLNQCPASRVAVDVPSGLFCDSHNNSDIKFKADHTVTFQAPKLSFFMPENGRYVGEWHVVDIGLSPEFLDKTETPYQLLNKSYMGELVKPRDKFTHKGTFGHLLTVGGSKGKSGAIALATQAGLRTGAGLVTAFVPEACHDILQGSIPESMCLADSPPAEYLSGTIADPEKFDVLAIGPGMGKEKSTSMFLKELLAKHDKPVVLDADALNIISEDKSMFPTIPKGSIITPHPKEFERLAGEFSNSFERLEKQLDMANTYGLTVIVKGRNTMVATMEGEVFINTTGNAGMATGGTGDVLTGMVGAMLAQQYNSQDAANLAVYLHGLAAEFAMEKESYESMVALDIVRNLGKAWKYLHAKD